jgi:DNA-binding MarR family transcriptional regulator
MTSVEAISAILPEQDTFTRADIAEQTRYKQSSVTNALRKLREKGVIERVPNFEDMRTYLYRVSKNPGNGP